MSEAWTLLPAYTTLWERWYATLEETVRQQAAMDQDGSAWAERRATLRRIPSPASPDGLASEADDRSGAAEAVDRSGATDSDEPRRVIIVDEYL